MMASVVRSEYIAELVRIDDVGLVLVDPEPGASPPSNTELRELVEDHFGPATPPVLLAELGNMPSLAMESLLFGSRLLGPRRRYWARLSNPLDPSVVSIHDARGRQIGTVRLTTGLDVDTWNDDEGWLSDALQEHLESLGDAKGAALDEVIQAAYRAWRYRVEDRLRATFGHLQAAMQQALRERAPRLAEQTAVVPWSQALQQALEEICEASRDLEFWGAGWRVRLQKAAHR